MSPLLPEDTTIINVPELQSSSPIEELEEIEIHHDPLPP